jgi:hypothetical protein
LATSVIVTSVIIALLLGAGSGVLVYKQIEYGSPPDWQVQIISRFTAIGASGMTLVSYQFEYQGVAKTTDLHGSGGTQDAGMWSFLVDATSSMLNVEHMRTMSLLILQSGVSYQAFGAIVMPLSTFQYDGTAITTEATGTFLLTIASDYTLTSHVQK